MYKLPPLWPGPGGHGCCGSAPCPRAPALPSSPPPAPSGTVAPAPAPGGPHPPAPPPDPSPAIQQQSGLQSGFEFFHNYIEQFPETGKCAVSEQVLFWGGSDIRGHNFTFFNEMSEIT